MSNLSMPKTPQSPNTSYPPDPPSLYSDNTQTMSIYQTGSISVISMHSYETHTTE